MRTSAAVLGMVLATAGAAQAQEPGELNPFECHGRYEAATANRTIAQIRHELAQRLAWLDEPGEAPAARAVKLCVIGRLEARVGDPDAYDYFLQAIEADPREPGWELFAAQYWAGARGARRPVTETAERHAYQALQKLEALRAGGGFREHHAVVEEWVRKQLLVLHQQDGLPLLPWKAYPQSPSGRLAPGLTIASEVRTARNTRDFFHNSEMRQFTGEASFAASDVRAGALTARQLWNIPRAPLRYQVDSRVRLFHRYLGALDATHSLSQAFESQITSFYTPDAGLSDIVVQQLGAGYQRVLPLYPLFDFRVAGSYRRVQRRGAIEFLPMTQETFNLFEARPSLSRFVGANKVTVDLVYALLDLPDVTGGVPPQRLRQKIIRAFNVEYAVYAPLVLPSLEHGSLRAYRTPTRGWYFYGGAAQDDEVYGLRTVTHRDVYAGTRFEGPARHDVTIQGTYYASNTTLVSENDPMPRLYSDPRQAFSSFRTTLVVGRRIIDPEARPGIPPSTAGFGADMLNLVFPVTHDLGLSGRRDYENVRGGAQLWLKLFGTGLGGTAFLVTLGYDVQYFYRIEKAIHMGELALRMGWGELLKNTPLLALALACGPAQIRAQPLPSPPAVPALQVGSGFVLTAAPAGTPIAVDRRGHRVTPKVTDDFAGPPTTSKWWSSLIWQFDPGNPYSGNLYAHPLALRARAAGLGLSYPDKPIIERRAYMYPYAEDLLVGLDGLASPDTRVASYSDWAVTAEWRFPRAGGGRLRATFGHGLPFVYLTKQGAAAAVVRVADDKADTLEVWAGEGGPAAVLGVTVGDHHYGIFGPSGCEWTRSGATFLSDLGGKDYFSVAVLPDRRPETLELFRHHAYAFVEETRVSWSYEEATAQLSTRFSLRTARKEGAVGTPLVALYRHQWLHTTHPLLDHRYVSPRGQMKLAATTDLSTSVTFGGVLPALPEAAPGRRYDPDALRGYVDQVYRTNDLFPVGLGPRPDHDAYWTGKSLGKLASIVQIADAIGYVEARDHLLRAIENELAAWFDGRDPRTLYYDRTWKSVIALPPSYDSSAQLNDHHFHYGYFVLAAAVVARYDPAWARQWREPVEMLIRDAASWDRDDQRFPFLRHMDPYAGHSWANGPAQYEDGNNQEASSEDINFSTGVLLWGALTDNPVLRDLGIFLHATQVVAAEQYWFDVDRAVFPPGFAHPAAGMVWGAGAKYDTWFDQNPILVHGINFLPFTGGSLYLGRRADYVLRNHRELVRRSGGQVFTWRDYVLMYLALADGARAVRLLDEDRYFLPEFGNSMALTYSWIHSLATLGRVVSGVTADVPTYGVFEKGAARTYAAFNPTAAATRVLFSDGFELAVGPRQLAHGKKGAPP